MSDHLSSKFSVEDEESLDSVWEEGSCESDHASTAENSRVKAAREERKNLALRETRVVQCCRLLTLAVLLITTAVVTAGVFIVTRNSQEDTFQNEYDAGAAQVVTSFHTSMQQFMDSFDTLSTSITSYAKDTGSTFPNVTIPDFEVRATNSRILARAIFVLFLPVVTDEQRDEWEAYAGMNYEHYMESYVSDAKQKHAQDAEYGIDPTPAEATEGEQETTTSETEHENNRRLDEEIVITQQVYRDAIWGTTGNGEVEAKGSGPYLPWWQASPVVPLLSLVNFNVLALDYFKGPGDEVLKTGMASLGTMTHLNDPSDELDQAKIVLTSFLSYGQYRHTLNEYLADPLTMFTYPVFDKLTVDRQVVGTLESGIYWRLLFTDVLPEGGNSVFTVVVRNTFGQSETFRVNGPEATYIGSGDLHDPAYDHMELVADVSDYLAAQASPETRSYTAADLQSAFVSYTVHVYPTKEMEEFHLTNEPMIYALVVAGIFSFTTLVFLTYNWVVERRQRLVLDKAAKSTAVVKSLFPATVQARLFQDTEEVKTKKSKKEKWSAKQSRVSQELSEFISSDDFRLPLDPEGAAPIADLFPEATIYFADLAGFTRWSSDRKPTEVFGLLETIYGAFDKIAKRHKVFKVETIGDCYVAVTGVPEPQPDHAVIMAKFAANCLLKFKQLLPGLADDFGPETRDLCIRTGMHSGSVTAGVLRGDRSRFQLFGDTVNTAARMESNGVPGRIHCSEAMAKKLQEAGKGSWLRLRGTKIHAKGKGEMQTYWIDASRSRTVYTDATDMSSTLPSTQPSSFKEDAESTAGSTSTGSGDLNTSMAIGMRLRDTSPVPPSHRSVEMPREVRTVDKTEEVSLSEGLDLE